MELETMTYEVSGRIARITLNRPERGNGITFAMPRELAACVERADLDPRVHVILLSGNGKGFCGGYDLVASAEGRMAGLGDDSLAGSPLDPASYDPAGGSHLVTKVGIDATRKANYPLEISTPGVNDVDLTEVFGDAWKSVRQD